jgi:hypothetical protein
MSEQDKALMTEYEITCETQIIYRYKEHRYENLKDAVNFAKIGKEHAQEDNIHKVAEE